MTTIADERISHLSTEYVKALVTATDNGAAVDPTSDVVKMVFAEHDAVPDLNDLVAASWETAGGLHWARCLVGPDGGAVELTVGLWDMHVQVRDSPETPLKYSGILQVY